MKIDTGREANVVDGAMPSRQAGAGTDGRTEEPAPAPPPPPAVGRTNGLNDDPACRSPCTARLNWLSRKLSPPYIATISPVRGRIATSAAAGLSGALRTDSIAFLASRCRWRSSVVWTLRPPPNTWRVPYFEISCCLT